MNDPSFPWLEEEDWFPFPEPDEDGLVAVGGNLSPGLLLSAYRQGVFPWFNSDRGPILWWNLDPRMILLSGELRESRSLRRSCRTEAYRITLDSCFDQVITGCATARRKGEKGTWITPDMINAYTALHRLGYAHSAEAWSGDELVGGAYGVSLGGCFFGESMFSLRSGGSRQAFMFLAKLLFRRGFTLIDGQQETAHFASFGARPVPRKFYLDRLEEALRSPTLKGSWSSLPAEGVSP